MCPQTQTSPLWKVLRRSIEFVASNRGSRLGRRLVTSSIELRSSRGWLINVLTPTAVLLRVTQSCPASLSASELLGLAVARKRTILPEIALLLPTGVWRPLQHFRRDLVDAAIDQRGRST
jgi:hypothetical protein